MLENAKLIPFRIHIGILKLKTRFYKRFIKHNKKLIDRKVYGIPMLRDLPGMIWEAFKGGVITALKSVSIAYKGWKAFKQINGFYKMLMERNHPNCKECDCGTDEVT